MKKVFFKLPFLIGRVLNKLSNSTKIFIVNKKYSILIFLFLIVVMYFSFYFMNNSNIKFSKDLIFKSNYLIDIPLLLLTMVMIILTVPNYKNHILTTFNKILLIISASIIVFTINRNLYIKQFNFDNNVAKKLKKLNEQISYCNKNIDILMNKIDE